MPEPLDRRSPGEGGSVHHAFEEPAVDAAIMENSIHTTAGQRHIPFVPVPGQDTDRFSGRSRVAGIHRHLWRLSPPLPRGTPGARPMHNLTPGHPWRHDPDRVAFLDPDTRRDRHAKPPEHRAQRRPVCSPVSRPCALSRGRRCRREPPPTASMPPTRS